MGTKAWPSRAKRNGGARTGNGSSWGSSAVKENKKSVNSQQGRGVIRGAESGEVTFGENDRKGAWGGETEWTRV